MNRRYAKELVEHWDKTKGQSWSDDTEEIVNIMECYANEIKNEILETMDKGTRNRRWHKVWERKIREICGASE